jgi:hypothetical protein
MRSSIVVVSGFFLIIIAACGAAAPPDSIVPEITGRLEDTTIREASGLARSQRVPGVLWVINDSGAKKYVHAIDQSGARLGEFKLRKSRNSDWEDLASFVDDDVPYLMVADIGDNSAKRSHRTLYFVEEPIVEKDDKVTRAWKIDYRYPDGPRDAESAAIDTHERQALVLSKRDLPPQLYSVPLQAGSDEPTVATLLGTVNSLRKPSRQEVEYAPKTKSWAWQPVGMDISEDTFAAVILTYEAVYYYNRLPDQTWIDALNGEPARVGIGSLKNAEAIAFSDDKRQVVVTGEAKRSKLLRIDFNGVTQ